MGSRLVMMLLRTAPLLLTAAWFTIISAAPNKNIKFDVYWNIPTFVCHKYGLLFNVSQYGIIQNNADEFRGEKLTILYDPGMYPAFMYNVTDSGGEVTLIERNGGLPQLGDVDYHLNILRRNISEIVPDPNFSGLAVIDFESWRPIFRQNWATLKIYKEESIKLQKVLHPLWTKERIKHEAKEQFEQHAYIFMLKSVALAREMRPRARWGYYGFPYCFNYEPQGAKYDCPCEVKHENNELGWLFEASDALYPSLYMSYNKNHNFEFVLGRLAEAQRLANSIEAKNRPLVYPYVRDRFVDMDEFLTPEDLLNSVGTPRILGLAGAVLWGSSGDLNTKDKCLRMHDYVQKTLGPIVNYIRTSTLAHLEDRILGPEITGSSSDHVAVTVLAPHVVTATRGVTTPTSHTSRVPVSTTHPPTTTSRKVESPNTSHSLAVFLVPKNIGHTLYDVDVKILSIVSSVIYLNHQLY